MKYYNLIKLNQLVKSFRLKFLGVYFLHKTKQRYLALHFDPVNACNLRCKMCYFTDKDYVKKLKGVFPIDDIDFLGKAFFSRALKLQIGCGTEPTLYKNLSSIIKTATNYKVPNISLTTNANLLNKKDLEDWALNGLSEITVSLHGVNKESYENMMGKGDFEKFLNSLLLITEVKKKYPLKLRINYTFNEDNFEELNTFFEVFNEVDLDILQIRPIVKIGNTEYNNFSLKKVIPIYESVHQKLQTESLKKGVKLLAHKPSNLKNRKSINSVIKEYTYCYISPSYLFRDDFKWKEETYNNYAKRTHLTKKIWKDIFKSRNEIMKYADERLNYDVVN